MTMHGTNTPALRWVFGAVLAALLFWVVYTVFSPWMFYHLFGDDLQYYNQVTRGACATRYEEILSHICAERFRPVASSIVISEMHLFGPRMGAFNLFNVIVTTAIALVSYGCALRLGKGRMIAAAACAIAVATCRFALYHATQAIAPVESITLLLALCSVYCVIRFDEDTGHRTGWAIASIVSAFLAIHSHERFLLLPAWLALVMATSSLLSRATAKRLAALVLACLAVPVFYVVYKTIGLTTPFMIGTGGTRLSLDTERAFGFFIESMQSIGLINRGPDYLVGASTRIGWNPLFISSVVFIASWASLLLLASASAWTGKFTTWMLRIRWQLLLLLMAMLVLGPAMLTIRLEQRWLMAPFTLLVLAASWAPKARRGHVLADLRTWLMVLMAAASVYGNQILMRTFGGLYLLQSSHVAESAVRDIVATHSGTDKLGLIAAESHCKWTLDNGFFFKLYGNGNAIECYTSPKEAIADGVSPSSIYSWNTTRFVRYAPEGTKNSTSDAAAEDIAIDLVKEFKEGAIPATPHMDTPSGKPIMILSWPTAPQQGPMLVVLSPYSYTYKNIKVEPGVTQLRLDAGLLYPAPQPMRITVNITGEKDRTATGSLDLAPTAADGIPTFVPLNIDMKIFSGQVVNIQVVASSPGGDGSSHWAGIANPRLLRTTTNQPATKPATKKVP